MKRLSKLSVENLKIADRIVIKKAPGYQSDCYSVSVFRNGNISFLHDGSGEIMHYSSPYHAVRACRRHSSVQPTTI